METNELLRRVRRIEIKSKRLTNNVFAGEYHSAFKGQGMSFAEVREYQMGDDVRNIDWNVTARLGRPHVKVFEEERELTVMLLIDVSASLDFGTSHATMRDMASEIAATISFSALQNNDKVGAIFFSDKIEKFIPPQKGRKHILLIIRELLAFKAERKKTDLKQALEYLSRVMKKKCIAFLMSDFLDANDYSHALRLASKKHDLVALNLYDRRMSDLPDVGLIKVFDAETGYEQYLDTSSKTVRKLHHDNFVKSEEMQKDLFRRSGIDYASIGTHEDYVKPLINLFAKR